MHLVNLLFGLSRLVLGLSQRVVQGSDVVGRARWRATICLVERILEGLDLDGLVEELCLDRQLLLDLFGFCGLSFAAEELIVKEINLSILLL